MNLKNAKPNDDPNFAVIEYFLLHIIVFPTFFNTKLMMEANVIKLFVAFLFAMKS